MGRYLIVANQTVGGSKLDQRVRDRIEHGEGRFYVVVPMAAPEHEVSTRPSTDVAFGVPISTSTQLDAMLERIVSLGGKAEGEVGATDPMAAGVVARLRADRGFWISTTPGDETTSSANGSDRRATSRKTAGPVARISAMSVSGVAMRSTKGRR